MNTPVRTLIGSLAVIGALAAAASSASAAVVINEVESDDPVVTDYVELMNTDTTNPVDISGYVIKDSDDGHAFTIPNATMIAAGGYYVADVDTGPNAFGLGKADSARLFTPGPAPQLLDSYAWTSHAAATYGRCPNGTGPMSATNSSTRGAANDCPIAAEAWLGSSAVATADGDNVFGQNLSGLAYQPSGSGAPGVLWAVRNNPSTLYRLIFDGTKWTPDTAGGWGAGKQLVYPDGMGVPDAEGVTLAGGDANGIYVSVERNDDGPNSNTSRPAILRYDVSSAGATLTATREWNLTADLPGLGANAGLEAVTWVPDALLVSNGVFDEAAGATYDPATYPDHGAGLFFAGVEQDGRILAYALNQKTGAFTRVATIASGFPKVMELTYEPETTHLWAVCDDSCNGRTATLDIKAGRFAVSHVYERPAGMPNLNNEGFAIAPQAECAGGRKPVFWSDDSNTDHHHALRSGAIDCKPLAPQPGPGPSPSPSPQPAPHVPGDHTAPKLKVALKLAKSGKARITLTLSERAKLTLTLKARKHKHALLKTTRAGVRAGQRALTLRVKHASLHRGEKVTLTVQARDAAGNVTTRRVTAKVR